MSETPFPVPRTAIFNPEAWGSSTTVSEDDIAFLGNHFVTFPETQPDVTFPVAPTVPTLPIGTGDTRAASAQFVQNAKNTRTWGALQTFNGGMVTNFVDPTTPGGTLTIGQGAANNNVEVAAQANRSTILHLGDGDNSAGAVHIGNGTNSSNNVQILNGTGSTGTINLGSATSTTRLNCPLTPTYTYPIAAGKIGQVISSQLATFNVAVVNAIYNLTTISLTPGVWVITGDTTGPALSTYVRIGFGTDPLIVSRASVNMIQNPSNPSQCNTSATISLASTTTIYFIGAFGSTQTLTNVLLQACRIA